MTIFIRVFDQVRAALEILICRRFAVLHGSFRLVLSDFFFGLLLRIGSDAPRLLFSL